jgi:tyrosyl-tRNA synthetase
VLALKPRDAKAALARQIVNRLHGDDEAGRAEDDFNRKFRRGDVSTVSARSFKAEATVADVALQMQWAPSFSAVRKIAEQGGLRVNDQKVSADHRVQDGDVVRYGKKSFVRVEIDH